ncbi:MAG: hypothetical protein QOF24_1570 [Verrucomicrobiota bacterium]|jgi:hypothetical protein
MTVRPKLRLLLLRDAVYFVLMLGIFYLPSPFGLLLFAAAVFAGGKLLEPKIKADSARLDASERRLYLGFTLALFLILLGLLLRWIIQHSSPPAWAMGGLGIVVLLVLFYASYDAVHGRNAKV